MWLTIEQRETDATDPATSNDFYTVKVHTYTVKVHIRIANIVSLTTVGEEGKSTSIRTVDGRRYHVHETVEALKERMDHIVG